MPSFRRNTRDGSFTLNIDLATTILDAAGIHAPHPKMHGKDIAHLYLPSHSVPPSTLVPTNHSQWRQEFFYEFQLDKHREQIPACTALVRKDFKYISWPQFRYEQLFHLTVDPLLEQNDLANQSEYKSLLMEMRDWHNELKQSVL